MTIDDYQEETLRTAYGMKYGKFRDKMDGVLANGLIGLNGEAGECIEIFKKYCFQGHELNKEHLAEELGDVLWYAAVSAHAIGYTLSDIVKMNVKKLILRYPDGFDSERSINREGEKNNENS